MKEEVGIDKIANHHHPVHFNQINCDKKFNHQQIGNIDSTKTKLFPLMCGITKIKNST